MKGRPAPARNIIIDGKLVPELLDEDTIHSVVHGFYDRIRKDDLLAPLFAQFIPAEEWPVHLAKMCDFWSATLLRTRRYEGRPLPPHLAIPDLGKAHFQRWLFLFSQTVDEFCQPDVAELFLDRAMRIAHSFRLAIAFNRGEDTTQISPILREHLTR